jgi:hypothetical protein
MLLLVSTLLMVIPPLPLLTLLLRTRCACPIVAAVAAACLAACLASCFSKWRFARLSVDPTSTSVVNSSSNENALGASLTNHPWWRVSVFFITESFVSETPSTTAAWPADAYLPLRPANIHR